jgi:hypothetical protein
MTGMKIKPISATEVASPNPPAAIKTALSVNSTARVTEEGRQRVVTD